MSESARSMHRRRFLQALGTTTAAAAVHPSISAAADAATDAASLPIIDTHQHLWDLARFDLPWLKNAPEILRRSYVTADYLAATAGLNVVQCVYMEVDLAPTQQVQEADYVIQLSEDAANPTVAGVISGQCDQASFADYIKAYRQQPAIKGVRQLLQDKPTGFGLQVAFVKAVQLLGELGMSFDLTIRPTELLDGLSLVKQCPGTRFVIDHCGVADPKAFMRPIGDLKPSHDAEAWKKAMALLADQPHTICKISGIVAHAPPGWQTEHLAPIVNHCLDVFGPDRVVFGGDWPVCLLGASFQRWVGALKQIVRERPLEAQRKLFSENAVRFYGLAAT